MRKPLSKTEKRGQIIGIKVKNETKEKIQYLSGMEDKPMSTFINDILEKYIDNYTKYHKINWNEIMKEE